MRLGLKIPKNSVDRGESWAVQTFNSKKNGAKRTGKKCDVNGREST